MIRCEHLVKRYGKTTALDSFDLHVPAGEIHGFVGPNGAGKTTAMRILSTLLRPTAGDAFVDGVSVLSEPQRVRSLVGYMPDFFGVYDNLKAWEYLDFYAGCTNMDARTRRRRIDELLELTALSSKREAMVDGLSRGMKQRLCLARALMHDPKLLILDEPASGMDPRARAQMRDILREIGQMGKTVLVSSHILPELSELCTSMTIMEKGKRIFSGSMEALNARMNSAPLVVRFERTLTQEEACEAREVLTQMLDAAPVLEDGGVWRTGGGEKTGQDAAVLRALMDKKLPVCAFAREKVSLERAFMEVTRDAQSDL